MVSNRDVLCDVVASITVDPTPLERLEVAACVMGGRAVYRYERGAEGGALGLSHWATAGRRMGKPNAYLPSHRCGFTFVREALPEYREMIRAHEIVAAGLSDYPEQVPF
jgi:hypothetical protein